jgi:hypothetical protein
VQSRTEARHRVAEEIGEIRRDRRLSGELLALDDRHRLRDVGERGRAARRRHDGALEARGGDGKDEIDAQRCAGPQDERRVHRVVAERPYAHDVPAGREPGDAEPSRRIADRAARASGDRATGVERRRGELRAGERLVRRRFDETGDRRVGGELPAGRRLGVQCDRSGEGDGERAEAGAAQEGRAAERGASGHRVVSVLLGNGGARTGPVAIGECAGSLSVNSDKINRDSSAPHFRPSARAGSARAAPARPLRPRQSDSGRPNISLMNGSSSGRAKM